MEKIRIEKPCDASWQLMSENDKGRHCQVCKTTVVDFTNMALEDIHTYFKTSTESKIGGRYHNRHTDHKNGWYDLLNKIETNFLARKYKKLALSVIYILLFLTGCKTMKNTHTMGDTRYLSKANNKHHPVTASAPKMQQGKNGHY